MAPTRSVKKPASGKGALPSSKPSFLHDEFRTTKKDKRLIKHSSFVSRIEKNSQKSTKRRRASKKLAALDSLADALPDADDDVADPSKQVNIIKQKTLQHRPGAMKRREKLERLERDRFAKNMAQMSSMQAPAPTTTDSNSNTDEGSVSNRWAALRNFISQTMEQQPAFKSSS
ncbi:hypothetical protein BO85DRAFT_434738 [Aspergillus piperis CBS 112811]|uniref:Ribosome biogenesis protein SLX9 n=2 Tax=Aspergillus subgen. Circumdati TaxID=2720871 RepID=A0A8G1VRQ5_9EURO|nr:hypothetical protein BO85DRAFT_434738 [Aspergillus piperis CBS 112811]OJZ92455.1 hypothetical protein ASPFODRAFT_28224 [Aspergillus luchuensis CBS 106.47]RAH62107.1 hypothetical protein BO85DRAFT_434738 [Aspergillus piperis CBS 112811]